MADTAKQTRIPEFLKEPLEAAQSHLQLLETEAQKVIRGLGQLLDLKSLRGQFDRFRGEGINRALNEGRHRAQDLRHRAGVAGGDALKRFEGFQARAVTLLGGATREELARLSHQLESLTHRLDAKLVVKPAKSGRSKSSRSSQTKRSVGKGHSR